MAEQLKQMTIEEFVRRILNGEQDFRTISLQSAEKFNEYSSVEPINHYLARKRKQSLAKGRYILDFTGSSFVGLWVSGLYLPRLMARGADFTGAYLSEANFSYGDFSGARFTKACLTGADFSYSNLSRVVFEGADLEKVKLSCATLTETSFSNANMFRTKLYDAELNNARDLETVSTIDQALFGNTVVSEYQKEFILRSALQRLENLLVIK